MSISSMARNSFGRVAARLFTFFHDARKEVERRCKKREDILAQRDKPVTRSVFLDETPARDEAGRPAEGRSQSMVLGMDLWAVLPQAS